MPFATLDPTTRLEEVVFSDFLLHVIDVSAPGWEAQRDAVVDTLTTLGAQDKPTVTVFNKIDRVEDKAMLRRLVAEFPNSVAISATTGEGISDLMNALVRQVRDLLSPVKALVPYSESGLVQDCYDYGRVHKVDYRDEGIYVEADLVDEMRQKLERFAVP